MVFEVKEVGGSKTIVPLAGAQMNVFVFQTMLDYQAQASIVPNGAIVFIRNEDNYIGI